MKTTENVKKQLKVRMKKDSGYLITAYPKLHKEVIKQMIKPFNKKNITKVMSPESKGLFFGPTIAYKLEIPFVFISKGKRIPKKYVISKSFRDYSKKIKTLEIAKNTIKKGDKVLIVDDVFESGKSGRAIIELIEKLGGKVKGISIIYNKLNKKDEIFFDKYNFHYLVKIK